MALSGHVKSRGRGCRRWVEAKQASDVRHQRSGQRVIRQSSLHGPATTCIVRLDLISLGGPWPHFRTLLASAGTIYLLPFKQFHDPSSYFTFADMTP